MFMVLAKPSAGVWGIVSRDFAAGTALAASGLTDVFPAFFGGNAGKRRKMLVFSNNLIDFRLREF
jgi:hypothetical protein